MYFCNLAHLEVLYHFKEPDTVIKICSKYGFSNGSDAFTCYQLLTMLTEVIQLM